MREDAKVKLVTELEVAGKKEFEDFLAEQRKWLRDLDKEDASVKKLANTLSSKLVKAANNVNKQLKLTPTQAYKELAKDSKAFAKDEATASKHIEDAIAKKNDAVEDGVVKDKQAYKEAQKTITSYDRKLWKAMENSQRVEDQYAEMKENFELYEGINSADDLNEKLAEVNYTISEERVEILALKNEINSLIGAESEAFEEPEEQITVTNKKVHEAARAYEELKERLKGLDPGTEEYEEVAKQMAILKPIVDEYKNQLKQEAINEQRANKYKEENAELSRRAIEAYNALIPQIRDYDSLITGLSERLSGLTTSMAENADQLSTPKQFVLFQQRITNITKDFAKLKEALNTLRLDDTIPSGFNGAFLDQVDAMISKVDELSSALDESQTPFNKLGDFSEAELEQLVVYLANAIDKLKEMAATDPSPKLQANLEWYEELATQVGAVWEARNADINAAREEAEAAQEAADTPPVSEETRKSVEEYCTSLLRVNARLKELKAEQTALENKVRLGTATEEDDETYAQNIADIEALKAAKLELEGAGEELEQQEQQEQQVNREYAEGILGIIQKLEDLQREKRMLERKEVSDPGDGQRYAEVVQEIQELTEAKKQYFNELKGVTQEEKREAKTRDTVRKSTKKFANAQRDLNRSLNNMKGTLKKGLTAITKYVLGFRSLFFLVRKLKSMVKEGLDNLVQFDSANNKTNEEISKLRSSLLFLKNAWAAAVAPILNVVIPILNTLIDAFAKVGNAIGMFFARLTGQSKVIQAVKADMGDYAKSLDKSAGSSSKASKAADKLHDRLAAFDDLNVLGKDDTTDPNSSTGGGGGNPDDMPSINEMFKWDVPENYFADLIRDAIDKGDFTSVGRYLGEKIKAVFNEINWDEIRSQMASKVKWITTFLNGLLTTPYLFGTVGRNLAEAINTGITSVRKFVKGIKWKEIFANIGDGITEFFTTFDLEEALATVFDIADALMEAATGLLEGTDFPAIIESLLTDLGNFLVNYDWKGFFTDLGELIGAAFKALWDIGVWLGELVVELGEELADYFWPYLEPYIMDLDDDAPWYEVAGAWIQGLKDGIVDALKSIGQWLLDNVFRPIYDGICNAFEIHSPSKVMEDIGMNIIEGMLNGITNLIDTVKEPFVNLKNKLIELWSTIKSKASEVWGGIKTTILNVAIGIKNNVVDKFELIKTKIVDSVTSMKDTVVNLWEGIWNGIKGIINNILGGVESLINGMIGGINKFADILNGFSFELPEALTDAAKTVGINITDNTIGFDLPKLGSVSIPRLAQGAVIPPNKEFLAMLGDQSHGTNIEAPLDTIKQALAEVMGNLQVENTGNAVMELDGQTFARLITPYVVSELDRRGYNVQVIGG